MIADGARVLIVGSAIGRSAPFWVGCGSETGKEVDEKIGEVEGENMGELLMDGGLLEVVEDVGETTASKMVMVGVEGSW